MGIRVFDMTRELPISLREAAELVPQQAGQKRPSVDTIRRWIKEGPHRKSEYVAAGHFPPVQLEGGYIGCKLVTSRESLQRFMERCSAAGSQTSPASSAPVTVSQQAAAEALRAAGY